MHFISTDPWPWEIYRQFILGFCHFLCAIFWSTECFCKSLIITMMNTISILCQSSLADLPLKSYYRYVVPTMVYLLLLALRWFNMQFDAEFQAFWLLQDDFNNVDSTISGPKAFFANMPLSKTLTMNLDVPEPWLVEPVIAVYVLSSTYISLICGDLDFFICSVSLCKIREISSIGM